MRRLFQFVPATDPWLGGFVVLLLSIALGCGLLRHSADPVPEGKTVLTLCKGGPKRDREEMKEFRAAFERANPDIHLNIIQSEMERKPDTMIAAGVAPDLIYILCDRLEYYIDAGALLDLTPMIDADAELRAALFGAADGTPPDFYPQTVTPLMRDGKLFVLPVSYVPFIVFYNKDLFSRYGVPLPDENWDWQGLRERAVALTRDAAGRRPDEAGFDPRSVVSYGVQYETWQHAPECFIRQNGGRLISDDGLRVMADDPKTVEALQFLYDLRHKYHACPPAQFIPGIRHATFVRGAVAMQVSGVFRIPTLRDQATQIDWDIAPLPRGPEGRRASVTFTNSWGISRTTKHPEAAFRLLKFMVSPEGLAITNRHRVMLPPRRSMAAAIKTADPNLRPKSTWVLTHDMDHGYATPPFHTRQYYTDVYEVINENLQKLLDLARPPFGPAGACAAMTREGNAVLQRDRVVRGTTGFGILAVALGIAPAAYLGWRLLRRSRRVLTAAALREERWGYALISPWLAGFLVFAAGPILISIALSLAQWQSLSEFTRSEYIGLENYRTALSGEDPKFWPSMIVTVRYAALAVPAGLVFGLALALLVNQRVRGIAAFRTLFYVPAILPSVAIAVLWWHLFDSDHGWINRMLIALDAGRWLSSLVERLGGEYPPHWLESPRVIPYVFIIMSLWTVGSGMIIYLAGLQSIPTQLYEAAEIDGAGRWRQLRHVTLPMLSPVIFFNLVMGLIGSFQVFNIAFVLFDGQPGPGDAGLFYGLHLFREAFFKYRLGYASALAWILFVLVLGLTALVFKSSPLWVYHESSRRKAG